MRHVSHVLLGAAAGSLLALGVLASPTEEPKIHECKDANGNAVYQDDPCPDRPLPKAVAPVPSKAAPSRARGRASAPGVPPPSSSRAERPREWRVVEPAPGDRFAVEAGGARPPSSGRVASPEPTWRAFVAAIRSGDRVAAAACLTPSALTSLGADAESLPLDRLRETVDAFTRVKVDGEVGPFWSIHALRPGRPPKWVLFERTGRGEWKIAGI